MAQLVVRNLEEDIKRRLQERAVRHGNSMEEEIRDILRIAAASSDDTHSPGGLGSRIVRRFAGLGLDHDLPEFRGTAPRAAQLDE